jgi:PAS domain S-box-containing protein
MKIRQKLLSAFLAVSLLTLGVSYGINWTIQGDALRSFQEVGGEILPGTLALSRMTTELYKTVSLALRYGEKRDRKDKQKIEETLSTLGTFRTMHVLYHHEDKAWHDRIDESTQRFSSYITEYILLVNKGEEEKLIQVRQKIDDVLNDFVSSVNPHIETEFTKSQQSLETTIKSTQGIQKILVASIVLLLLITLTISLFISHLISKPILQLRDAAFEIGQGKLDVNLRQTSNDEIGELAYAFNDMVAKLSGIRKELYQTNQRLKEQIAERSLTTQALQESEQNYREIFNATNEAIFLHDSSNGNILEVNQTVLDMYGYSYEESLGLTIRDLSLNEPPYSDREALQFVKKAVEEGPQVFEWRARRKNGEIFWVEVALSNSEIGGTGKVLAVVRDISDRKEIEVELLQSHKMEAVGTLAGGIAHDFNNILTAILGYSDLAKIKAMDNPELLDYLNEIHKSGIRARNLVAQILTFSRKSKEAKKNIQISLIVEDTLKMLRSTIPATIEIKRNIQSQATAFADSTQIHQIIMNLCTNAYHSMRDTGGVLAVSLNEVKLTKNDYPTFNIEAGRYLKLTVSDSGKGIDENLKEKIFEPYFTTKEAGEGTGLGLAVVHGIVKGHNGHISLYSDPGQGTTFHVYLPIVEAEDDDYLVLAEEKQAVGGTERIIIVDDEDAIVKFVQTALELHGYTITSYTNGLQALQEFTLRPNDFDLVITDMTMPYMTGAELSQKLIEIRPDIQIILCSGYSEIMNTEKAGAMGVAEYLEKPIIIDTLLKAIRNVLD